jgi:hypothetical protein
MKQFIAKLNLFFVCALMTIPLEAKETPVSRCEKLETIRIDALPYLSSSDTKRLYTTSKCENNSFVKYFSLTEDCDGQNSCVAAEFSSYQIELGLAALIEETFRSNFERIDANTGRVGYYIPSQCAVYCTHARILWFRNDSVYSLGTKISKNKETDIKEFKQILNSSNWINIF